MLLCIALTGCGGSSDSDRPAAPSGLGYTSQSIYAAGETIAPIAPAVTGAVTRFSVSPALPAGLTLDATTGAIAGTPVAAAAMTTYTVSASNETGSTTFQMAFAVAAVRPSTASIARIVSSETAIDVNLTLEPVHFAFSSDLHVNVSDPHSVFARAVALTPDGEGGYTLQLTTHANRAVGRYTGSLTLDLCRDANCDRRQLVGSLNVPMDIQVMAADTAWPGDTLSTLSAWPEVADWGTFQGNAAHTGLVPARTNPDDFSTRWMTDASAQTAAFLGQIGTVATGEDRVFTVAPDVMQLVALEEFDGSLAWQYDFSGLQFPSVNPPAVANGAVYIAAGQQQSTYLHAFDAHSGSLIFKSAMSSQWETYLAPVVGAAGVYTNAGTYGGLYALDATGQHLFFTHLPQTSVWSPALDDQHVYTYAGHALQVLDPLNGSILQTIVDPSYRNYVHRIGGAAVLGAPGSVFAANHSIAALDTNNTLLNFDVHNSTVRWQVEGRYPTTPAYDDGIVYATNHVPLRVEARRETDGELLGSWTPPHSADRNFASEVLLTENLLFVSTNRSVYALDRATYRPVWSFPASGHLALSRNGVLYIETADRLIAINLKH